MDKNDKQFFIVTASFVVVMIAWITYEAIYLK